MQVPKSEDQFSYLIQQSNSQKTLEIQVEAKASIRSLRLSGDNKYLAICHIYKGLGQLNIWDITSKKVKCSIKVPNMWADDRMSYFSKDSKYYFFALYDTDQLQIISLESRRGTITYCSLGDRLKETAVSLNPLYFCTVTPKQCLLWNQNTKKVDKKIENTLDFICCCFKNNDKELVTLSYQEQDATLISCWCLKKLKVLSQWTCKYISHSAKCYVIEETQILIIDYQDVHEHYFQIWNILGQSLIRILYEAIDSFYILNNFGSKLIVDCEDDEDDDNDENADKSDEYKWISIFDILTFKYQRFKTFIEQGQSFYVQEGALIIQNRKNNSEDVGIFINIK